jgi:putative ABC transport system permease protein
MGRGPDEIEREIKFHLAVRTEVVRMILGETGRIVIGGIVLGVLVSFGLMRLIRTFLFGVGPNDPATLAVSAIVLAAIGIVAAMLPAFRAARMDPLTALREE